MSSGEPARTPYSCLHSTYRVLIHSSIRRRAGAGRNISRRHAVAPPPLALAALVMAMPLVHGSGLQLQVSVAAPPSCPLAEDESARREEGTVAPFGTEQRLFQNQRCRAGRREHQVDVSTRPSCLLFFQPDCDYYCPGLWHMDCWPVFPVFVVRLDAVHCSRRASRALPSQPSRPHQ